MKTKVFAAKTMSEGLKKISNEFGDNAIILSKNKTASGIEITAAVEGDSSNEMISQANIEARPNENEIGQVPESLLDKLRQSSANGNIIKAKPESSLHSNPSAKNDLADMLKGLTGRGEAGLLTPRANPLKSHSATEITKTAHNQPAQKDTTKLEAKKPQNTESQKPKNTVNAKDVSKMREEIQGLKQLLETQSVQLNELVKREPVIIPEVKPREAMPAQEKDFHLIQKKLEMLGLSMPMVTHLVSEINPHFSDADAWKSVVARLSDNIDTYFSTPVEKGGVYSFIGMTGAGKTTCLGKIATQYVLQKGPEELLVVSVDNFRLGSQDSLKNMCKILGCDFATVSEENSLETILRKNAFRKLILIDTCGGVEGIHFYLDQISQGKACKKVKPLAVLSCTTEHGAMSDQLHSYQQYQPVGCILSKLDESRAPGAALSVSLSKQLPVAYWSDGQAMATDLHHGNSQSLMGALLLVMKRKNSLQTSAAMTRFTPQHSSMVN